jgi:hypothetical protein
VTSSGASSTSPHFGTLQLGARPASAGGVTPNFVARRP